MKSRKLQLEPLEDRTLLAVTAGAVDSSASLAAPTEGATWVVNTLDDPVGWETNDDVLSLREAIARSGAGDIIIFDAALTGGIITLNGTQIEITKSVTIDAADIGGITIDADTKSRVISLVVEEGEAPVQLTGLTVTGGNADQGAAILNESGFLTLSGCVITRNRSMGLCGGVYNSGTLAMFECVVSDNTGPSGAGLSNTGSLSMVGCTVTNNTGSYGGGINSSGTLSMTDCIVSKNSSLSDSGGGIYGSGSLTLTRCHVSENWAMSYGGGIDISSGTLTMVGCTVSGHRNSGGIYNTGGSLSLTDCLVCSNTSNLYGGGIFNYFGSVTLMNCTVSGNSAETGGGIYNASQRAVLEIFNSVIALNTASKTDPDLCNYYSFGTVRGYHSLSSFTGWGTAVNCLEYDPELPLFARAEVEDYRLAEDSQAINAGNNAYVKTEIDIAGNPRIVDGIVDIGAYELQIKENPSTVIVTTLEDVVDETDGLISLREAVNYAAEGDTVTFDSELAGGTILLAGNEIVIDKGITIDAMTIGEITIDANRKSRVFYVSGGNESTPVGMINLVITGGVPNNESNGYYPSSGGGIYNSGTLEITDSAITRNYAPDLGGGVYNDGTLTITNSDISDNTPNTDDTVSTSGGGIHNYGGTLRITSSTISGNTAYICGGIVNSNGMLAITDSFISGNSSEYGGGIFNREGTLTISNSIIADNSTNNDGGGIGNYGGSLVITDSTISENSAVYYGGGVYVESGTLTITNSTVTGNNAADIGGGIYGRFQSDLTLTNSFVEKNVADKGGGIYNWGMLTMTNCVVSWNDASSGGGIYSEGMLTLTNCTVSGNNASLGGGIYDVGFSPDCNTIFENTIIAQNTADNFADDVYVASATIYAYNTLSSTIDWSLSAYCLLYDPEKPLFVNVANGDYTLAENSQVIDKGNNSYVITETDLAGNPRIANGIVDIGAYEYQSGSPAEQLTAPVISTGDKGVFISYGANRHQIVWNAVENASGYELTYSTNGNSWTTVSAKSTSAIVTGLTYGTDVTYRVRALGTGSYSDSDWSAVKVFNVCPMDINGDGDISGGDRVLMVGAWLSGEGDDEYRYYCDINGDGDITGADRTYLSNNWLMEVGDDDLIYPRALTADTVFAEFASADLVADLSVF